MKDGHLNVCKSCVRDRVHKHREDHIEEVRAYDRERANEPHRLKARIAYAKKYRRSHPDKRAAHNAVARALASGKLKRTPCAVCGKKKTEAHHSDYSAPLAVRWLCSAHHKAAHK